jgi:hypothetical protein
LSVTHQTLAGCIDQLVRQDSEGGKRAQAAAAALFDAVFGPNLIDCGRINDPSRQHPGDVCIRDRNDLSLWEKAIEVRDKVVEPHDVMTFLNKCLSMGVREAAVLMASSRQQELDYHALATWAADRGMGLTLFYGWQNLTEQILFWSQEPAPEVTALVVEAVEQRLIALEASSSAFAAWHALTRNA